MKILNQTNLNLTNKRLHSALLSLIGVFLVFGTIVPANKAQAITISPPRIEVSGDPGTTVSGEIKVNNDTLEDQVYYTQIENFEAGDESGNPTFVVAQEGLATWVVVDKNFSVESGQEKAIPFSIKIPANAEPGGYFASIFVRTTPPPANGGEVSIGARVGSLVLLRVNGDIAEGVDILEFSTKSKGKFFTSLPVELYYRFQNTGADRVKPEGKVAVKNILGMNAKLLSANPTDGSVLPRSIRRFEMAWVNGGGGEEDPQAKAEALENLGFFEAAKSQLSNFAFGYYTAKLDITFGQNNNSAQESFGFFVIPWQLLLIVLVGLIVILVFFKVVLKQYTKYIIAKHGSN